MRGSRLLDKRVEPINNHAWHVNYPPSVWEWGRNNMGMRLGIAWEWVGKPENGAGKASAPPAPAFLSPHSPGILMLSTRLPLHLPFLIQIPTHWCHPPPPCSTTAAPPTISLWRSSLSRNQTPAGGRSWETAQWSGQTGRVGAGGTQVANRFGRRRGRMRQ